MQPSSSLRNDQRVMYTHMQQPLTHNNTNIIKEQSSSPIPDPQRLKVDGQADLAPPVHLGGLALQLRQLDLRGSSWVGGGGVKAKVELVLHEVVDVPGNCSLCDRQTRVKRWFGLC